MNTEVQNNCERCGDKLGHEEDTSTICRWCNEGWVSSDDDCETGRSYFTGNNNCSRRLSYCNGIIGGD